MDTALLVLDVQKDFVGESVRMPVAKHQIEPMIQKINRVIKAVKKFDMSIIYIGNEFEPKQFISNLLRHHAAIKGRLGAELDERLVIESDLYFAKNRGNALSNKTLVKYLEANHIKQLVIVGLFAEGCVAKTAGSAIRKNFFVTVLEDAVAGASDLKKMIALNKMDENGVLVTESEQFIDMLMTHKDHFANEITRLQ